MKNNNAIRTFGNHTPKVDPTTYIDPKSSIIGQVKIGKDSSIWPFASLRGDMHWISVGEGSSIQDGSIIHVTHAGPYNPDGFPTQIGNFVTVGHKVTLHGCTVQDLCVIGMDSIILDGAIVKSHVLLAAGSLVLPNKVLESGYLWAGRPAEKKRALTKEEIAFFEYSANNYIQLKNQYLLSQNEASSTL